MFKDTQKELQRLEAELMAQEDQEQADDLLDDEDDFGEDMPENYRNFSNRYKAYNADRTDWDPGDMAQELDRKRRPGIWVLCAIILGLIAGIFLLLAWWVVKFGGISL